MKKLTVMRCDYGCVGYFSSIISKRNHLRSCPNRPSLNDSISSSPEVTIPHWIEVEPGENQFEHIEEVLDESALKHDQNENEGNPTSELNIEQNQQIQLSTTTNNNIEKSARELQAEYEKEELRLRKLALLSLSITVHKLSRKYGAANANELIQQLNNPHLRLEDLRGSLSSLNQCRSNVLKQVYSELDGKGFQKVLIHDDSRNACVLYQRDIIDLLRAQISMCSESLFFCNRAEALHYLGETNVDAMVNSHPMASKLGIEGHAAVMNAVQSSSEPNHIWYTNSIAKSCPGFIQLYSDKSSTTLRASGFTFYPVHAVLLNFEESIRRRLIMSGKTILGYLPSKFLPFISDANEGLRDAGLKRARRIPLLHKCLRRMIEKINQVFLQGFSVSTSDNVNLRVHPVVANYVADNQEIKDLTGVFHNTNGTRNCHRCLIMSCEMDKYSNEEPRTILKMKQLLDEHQEMYRKASLATKDEAKELRKEGDTILKEFSMESYLPALFINPLCSTDLFDPYLIFSFDVLHNIHLGITKTLLLCLHELIKVLSNRPTSILDKCNWFLREVEKCYKCTSLHVDFSSSGKDMHMNGLFTSDGLTGFLEGKNYRHLEKVLPFLGSITDRELHDGSPIVDASVSKLFVTYVEMLRVLFRCDTHKYWTSTELDKLKFSIKLFKDKAVKVLGPYQTSGLKIIKFHMLDHVIEDIKKLGSLSVASGNLFEFSHILFKDLYKTTSKRGHEALDVTVSRVEEHLTIDAITEKQKSLNISSSWQRSSDRKARKSSKTKEEAFNSDVTSLSTPYLTVPLNYFSEFISNKGSMPNLLPKKKQQDDIAEFYSNVGEDGFEVLLSEINDIIESKGWMNVPTSSLNIEISSSAHSASIQVPTCEDLQFIDGLPHAHVRNSPYRFLYRIVSSRNYRNAIGLRQDAVILKNDSCRNNNPEIQCLWFGVVKSFISISLKIGNEQERASFAFVNYLEVCDQRDAVDKALGCINLRWERGSDDGVAVGKKKKRLDPGKWFALTPIESILGVLPIVPTNNYNPLDKETKIARSKKQFHSGVPWYDHLFYINRFYYPDEKETYPIEKNLNL